MTTNETRTVAVTGATGFVGRHLVRELLSRGHRVSALARSAKKAAEVLPRDAMRDGRLRIVAGDVLDDRSPDELLAGADACCHLIGILREGSGRQTFERMHVRATERMVAACERRTETLGSPVRYVQMSALGVGGESTIPYRATKYAAERAVRASSFAWTIMRPGLIHGPDGEFMQLAKSWAQGRAAPYVAIPVFTRPTPGGKHLGPIPAEWETATMMPVHVDDVAWAFAEALARPATVGEVYHLVGPERLTMCDVLKLVRDHVPLGKKNLRVLGLPGPLAAMKARGWRTIGMERVMPFDEGMARMATDDSVAPLDKERAQLGFTPRPFTPELEAYAPSM